MKIFDVVVLILIIWFAYKGFRRGFFDELFSLLAFIGGAWSTVYLKDIVLENFINENQPFANVLAMVIAFVVVAIVIIFIGKILKSLFNILLPDILEKILGLVFGAMKIVFLFGFILHIINCIDTQQYIFTEKRQSNSLMYKPCKKCADTFIPPLKNALLNKADNENIQCEEE